MVRAIFLEEIIVEISITQLPCMHQKPTQLSIREIEPIFPNIPILYVPIFLNLQIIGNRRKVSFIESKDALYWTCETGVRRNLGCIIDGIGQNASLFGLPLL